MRALLALPAFLTLLVATSPAQATRFVSGGGAALNQAIQQAAPGDRLVVAAALYDPLLADRGLLIECDPGVRLDANFGSQSRIANVPAGQQFTLRGATFLGSPLVISLQIDSCAGTVIVENATFDSQARLTGIAVNACAWVLFDSPRFPGSVPGSNNPWGGPHATSSSMVVRDCPSCPPVGGLWSHLVFENVHVTETYNASSLVARNSTVFVRGGTFPGSNFNIGLYSLPGIELDNSQLSITGSARATSGNGGLGLQGAIEGVNSTLRIDPAVVLGAPGQPIQGTVTVHREVLPWQVFSRPLRSGTPFTVDVHGAPQDIVYLMFDLPGPVLPFPLGSLWIDAASPLFDVVPIPAGGVTRLTFLMPPLPSALPLVFQSVRLGVSGEVAVGAPTAVVVN